MSFTSTDPSGLTFNPRNGDGTGIVDISGTLIADIVYAPGSIVRMAHYRQTCSTGSENNNSLFSDITSCSFIPLPIDGSSTIVCEAYFTYYNWSGGDDEYKITLTVSGDISTQDNCTIKHINQPGGGGRVSGRPLIINKDISSQNNDTFIVNLKYEKNGTNNLYTDNVVTFIFFQIAK